MDLTKTKTLATHYNLLAERVKHHIRTIGPREPEEMVSTIHHRYPHIVPFTVWTMLFSGEVKLNGFGEIVTLEQFDGREYVPEEVKTVPICNPVRYVNN